MICIRLFNAHLPIAFHITHRLHPSQGDFNFGVCRTVPFALAFSDPLFCILTNFLGICLD